MNKNPIIRNVALIVVFCAVGFVLFTENVPARFLANDSVQEQITLHRSDWLLVFAKGRSRIFGSFVRRRFASFRHWRC